ncbi:MAG: glycosyltransferase family 2 protein [Halothiobacillaceae bacterium]|nr:glycosyltransferase family 2 protein [Halothiobacillaceae bacterium]
MNYCIVIPAYNEQATLRDLVQRVLEQHEKVIVVDDGSVDATADCLEGLPVRLLRHAQNCGKAASLRSGARLAIEEGARWVVTLDGDGQHRPEDIAGLLDAARQHPDGLVIAARLRGRGNVPPMRRFANAFANFWISWAAGQRIADTQSGFRVYPAELFRELALPEDRHSGFVFESEILIEAAWRGYAIRAWPIEALYPPGRRASHYRPWRDTSRIVRMVALRLWRTGFNPRGLLSILSGSKPGPGDAAHCARKTQ